MHVSVIVPTYGNRQSIFRLLDSLAGQSHKDFSVLLVYKEKQGKKEILDRIKEFRKLNIDIITQKEGRFEEALNMAYSKADGDLGLNTDDDAYVDRDWIKDHVELHKKNRKVGVATGKVAETGRKGISGFEMFLYREKWRMNKHTIIDRPIDKKFDDYEMYIGRSGMLVDTGRRANMIRTFKQHGVNMSWKRDALHGFKLPCYTKQGGRNEASAALEVLKRGYLPIHFHKGLAFHPLQESDSRSVSVRTIPRELTAESVLFSYYVDHFSDYGVDLKLLRLRTRMDHTMSRLMMLNKNNGYSIGYRIAKEAIEGNWKPDKVRNELIEALSVV